MCACGTYRMSSLAGTSAANPSACTRRGCVLARAGVRVTIRVRVRVRVRVRDRVRLRVRF